MAVCKILTVPDDRLRAKSRQLTIWEMKLAKIKALVADIYDTLNAGDYGVGMSAIQIGEPLAVSVVMIRPTPNRPNLERFNRVYLNPRIVKTFGKKEPMWEGCCSVMDDKGGHLYAEVPRYKKIIVEYCDELGERHKDVASGFLAHVLQHEIDHINGVIFTDLVSSSSIVPQEQYRKAIGLIK